MVVIVALAMSAMLLGIGLIVDAGRLFDARRSAQSAADAAALAAAAVLYGGGTASAATAAALADAQQNGFTASSTTTVSAVSPPASGPRAGDARYAEVTITRRVATLLMGAQTTNVRARAVGGVAPLDHGYAVIALDSASTSGAISVSSNGSLALTGGGIMINSSHSQAGSSSGTVTIPSTAKTDVVGGLSGTWPNSRTGRPVLVDPLANFPEPDTSGLINYGSPVCCSLLPGVYTGSIGGNNAWQLAAGTYVLKGASIDLAGNSSLTGTGVFIFLTNANHPAAGGSCGTLKLSGNNASVLSAPTSGTYSGMLIYQDSGCTGDLTVGGNGSITATGTIYAPSATVKGNGNNAAITATQIVAKRVDAQNADLSITYTAAAAAVPRVPALEE